MNIIHPKLRRHDNLNTYLIFSPPVDQADTVLSQQTADDKDQTSRQPPDNHPSTDGDHAAAVIELLIDLIEGQPPSSVREFPTELIVRQSTGVLKG